MSGWIKLHRGLLKWEWYDHLPTKVLFLHLLLRANHKDNKYRGEIIKKGCLVTSREVLSRETGLSERQIRTALTNLKKTNEVTIKSSRKGTEIQIVKYSEYQQETNVKTKERPRNDQETTSNKNEKNKEEDNIIDDSFNEFWDLYDKKRDKKKCIAKWNKLKLEDKEAIIKIIPTYKKLKPDVQFRKDPIRFLVNEIWKDEELQESYKPEPKNKFEFYMQELEDEDKKVDTMQLYQDLESNLITPEEFKEIKRVSDANYIKKVNRA